MNDLNIINKVNNIPLEIVISILFMIVFVLFAIWLETLLCVKGDKKTKITPVVYVLGAIVIWIMLYQSPSRFLGVVFLGLLVRSLDKFKDKRDTIALMMVGPLLMFPLLQYVLAEWGFFAVDHLMYGEYINGTLQNHFIAQLLSYRILDFFDIMLLAYMLMNGIKVHQVYRKKIREEAEVYNINTDKITGTRMENIQNNDPEVLMIFDNVRQFMKEPVNKLNYIIYPVLIYGCALFAGPTNIYRGYVYSLAIFISIAVIVIQPLFFRESSKYGKYNFVLGMSKIIKYLVAAFAFTLIYRYLYDDLRDMANIVYSEDIMWSMRIPTTYHNKHYIFAYTYIIGNIIVFCILRPKMYLREYRYVNDRKNNSK